MKTIIIALFCTLLIGCTKVPSPSCTETLRVPARAQNGVVQPMTIIQYCNDSVQEGDITHMPAKS